MGSKHGGLDLEHRGSYYSVNNDVTQSEISDLAAESNKNIEMKFRSFITKLKLNESRIHTINKRRNSIEDVLSQELDIKEKHIIGSYSRGTMIESVKGNDIDTMFVLNDSKHGDWLYQLNGPKNCLLSIKHILENNSRFKNTEICIDKNVVTVKYGDFNIDVVPAFADPSGGYRIPDTSGNQSWKHTNPRMFKKIMAATNKANNGRVSNLVKIVKGWNESNGKPLKSFHIENMVYQHYENQSKDKISFNEDTHDFFSRLPWYIQNPSYEPVYGERIDTYITSKQRDVAITKAQRAKTRMDDAKKLEDAGCIEESVREYKKIFGKKFD